MYNYTRRIRTLCDRQKRRQLLIGTSFIERVSKSNRRRQTMQSRVGEIGFALYTRLKKEERRRNRVHRLYAQWHNYILYVRRSQWCYRSISPLRCWIFFYPPFAWEYIGRRDEKKSISSVTLKGYTEACTQIVLRGRESGKTILYLFKICVSIRVKKYICVYWLLDIGKWFFQTARNNQTICFRKVVYIV